jgi:hypothetical protein
VLFNRNDHGYYHLAVRATGLTNTTNCISYSTKGQGDKFASDIPIWLDPENKLTVDTQITWPLGRVSNASLITFETALYNCIERQRYDQAVFDTSVSDPNIQSLKGVSAMQPFFGPFGQSVPLYVIPKSYYPDQHTDGTIAGTFVDTNQYDADGNIISPAPGSFPSTRYVHTGVQVGDIDPTPGGRDYSTHYVTPEEKRQHDNSAGVITGSGYRTNAIIYPYTMELVFEITE